METKHRPIVIDDYPASRLPVELRGDLPDDARVRVVIAQETSIPAARRIRETSSGRSTTIEDAVKRVRALRDEWD